MSQQHRATPDNWHNLDQYRRLNRVPDHISITLELADRLAAAEQRISELEAKRPAAADHAPAGSLVEQVRTAILNHGDGGEYYDEARAAIRAVANAARSRDLNGQSIAVMTWEGVARWLEQEVERHG